MDIFLARQPIFDRELNVFGYELFFRTGMNNAFPGGDGSIASSKVIADGMHTLGLEMVTGGRPAFINFTRDLLLQRVATVMPKENVIIEILETIDPDPEVIAACVELKANGYQLALDDVDLRRAVQAQKLAELADIIKVDFQITTPDEQRALVVRFAPNKSLMLAEKVETRESFDAALRMGYCYFQGYFFAEPVIISSRDVPAFKINLLQLMREIHQENLNFVQLENIMKRDMAVAYKLLRYVNSAALGIRNEISSIKQALVMLGEREVKKWITLLALAGMGEDQPHEMVRVSLTRARLLENLASAANLGDQKGDLFLLGLFSLIDAVIGRPMLEILAGLPIAYQIKNALLGHDNRLRQLFDVVLAYEKANWDAFSAAAKSAGLDEKAVPEAYLQALEWTNQIYKVHANEAKLSRRK